MRSVTIEEPEWTDEDVEFALAQRSYRESLCVCGHPRSESFDPDNDHAYNAEPWACHACAARDRASEAWHKQDGKAHGIYFAVTRREED